MRFLKFFIFIGVTMTLVVIGYSNFFSKRSFFRPKNQGITRVTSDSSILENQSVFEKLEDKYCIIYGNVNAPLKIVEFFSFQCPYCVKLFREDFQKIKSSLIDTGKASFRFHPVPQDLATIQAMICLEKLEETEKKLFLEVLLEEAVPSDQELMTKLMITAMNVFKKPIPELSDHLFIKEHPMIETVFNFLKQEKILAVPSLEVNGNLFHDEIPTYQFINELTTR